MARLVRWLSRLAPHWRRDEWLREWLGELNGHSGRRPSRLNLTVGAAAHLIWLWRHEWSFDMIRTDIRYAFRTMARARAFTAAAVITLALGIGATAAMFSVIDAVLLRSFDYPASDRLVAVWPDVSVSPRAIHERRLDEGHPDVFEAIGAYSGWGFSITGGQGAEAVEGARVTPELLQVLGVQPLHGRLLAPGEGGPGRQHVALVGEGLWRRRFGGDPAAVGRSIDIGGVAHEIAGIMPATFDFPQSTSELWLPIPVDPAASGFDSTFAIRIARLAPGVIAQAADARLKVAAERLQRENPKAAGGRFVERARVVSLREHFVRDVRTPLVLLLVAVGLLLVLACTNVANLMLTRSAARRTELAVRSALGADRRRLVRQLLVENLVLAVAGGAAGVAVAYTLVEILAPLAPQDIPNIANAAVNGRALAVAAAIAVSSTLVFGLVPAVRAARPTLGPLLGARGSSRVQSGPRLRAAFAFSQVAIAMLLAVTAALLGRSFVNLARVDLGFTPENVLTLHAALPSFAYTERPQVRDAFQRLLRQINNLPGIEAAGVIQLLPLSPGNWDPGVRIDGAPDDGQFPDAVNWRTVSPRYFEAMRIPIQRGRALSDADDHNAMPVAVINETFARVVFRGADPLARRVRTGFEPAGIWVTIVGVVGDVRQHAVSKTAQPEMYRPFAQHPVGSMRLVARTSGDPLDSSDEVRAAFAAVDSNITVSKIEPMTAAVDRALSGTKLPLLLAAALSSVALTIGLVGIAGVIAFDVAERRPEIGIRLALGESPARIRATFLGRAAKLGIAGLAAGAAASLLANRLIETMLYGVGATDLMTTTAVGAVCLLAILGASYLPARAASRVDPLLTLRGE